MISAQASGEATVQQSTQQQNNVPLESIDQAMDQALEQKFITGDEEGPNNYQQQILLKSRNKAHQTRSQTNIELNTKTKDLIHKEQLIEQNQYTERKNEPDDVLETEVGLLKGEKIVEEKEFSQPGVDFEKSSNNTRHSSLKDSKTKVKQNKIISERASASTDYKTPDFPWETQLLRRKKTTRDVLGGRKTLSTSINLGKKVPSGIFKIFKYTNKSTLCMFLFGLFLAIVNGAIGASHAFIIAEFIDSLNKYQNDKDISEHIQETFLWLVLPLTITMLVLGLLQRVALLNTIDKLNESMRRALIKSVLIQDVQYFELIDREKMPEKLEKNFAIVLECVTDQMSKLFFAIGAILSAITISLATSPSFTAGLCLVLPFLLIVFSILSSCLFQKLGDQEDFESVMSDFSMETFNAMHLIIGQNVEAQTFHRFMEIQQRISQKIQKQKQTAALRPAVNFSLLILFIFFGSMLAAFYEENEWTRTWDDDNDYVEVNDYRICMEVFLYAAIFLPVFIQQSYFLGSAREAATYIINAIDRIPSIIDAEQDRVSKIITWSRGINFVDVCFKYPNSESHAPYILENANFNIEYGKLNVVIGETGCGKSAILKMLVRMYDTDHGQIRFGSHDQMKWLELQAYRTEAAFISASPNLIKGSIKNNLKLGKRNASNQEIGDALELANATFVFKLKYDLETLVGYSDRGIELNKSQILRLVIARVILQNPRLLLIEELSRQLDLDGRKKVECAIQNLLQKAAKENVTVVMETDYYQQVETADNVLYIQQPLVIQSNKSKEEEHLDLLRELKQTLYAKQDFEEKDLSIREEQDSELNVTIKEPKEQPERTRYLNSEKQDDLEYIKRKYYGTEAQRVLNLMPNKWNFRFIKLLSLLDAFVYPILALVTIKIQLLYFQYSWHQDEDKINNTFNVYLDHIGYYDQKKSLLYTLAITCIVSLLIQFMKKSLYATLSTKMEGNLRKQALSSVLFKEMPWFQQVANKPENLTQMLCTEITWLVDATLQREFLTFEIVVCMIAAFLVCAYISWYCAMTLMLFSPLLILFMYDFMLLLTSKTSQASPNFQPKAVEMLADIFKKHSDFSVIDQKNLGLVHDAYTNYYKRRCSRGRIISQISSGLRLGLASAGRNIWLILAGYMALGLLIDYFEVGQSAVIETIIIVFVVSTIVGFRFGQLPSWEKTETAARNIFSTIDEPSKMDVRLPADKDFQIRFGHVEFKNVSFAYHQDSPLVLKNLTLDVPAERRIGIVGNKGSGRTTIAHLLRRFYELDGEHMEFGAEGYIKIDGIQIREYSLRNLRSFVMHVPEIPVILDLSLRDNIALGRRDANDQQIYRAALLANATFFIEDDKGTGSDRAINLKKELHNLADKLTGKFPSFKHFATVNFYNFEEQGVASVDLMQLLRDIMQYSDLQTLQKIDSDPKGFIDNSVEVLKATKDPNLTWIELVLMIEWRVELQSIIEEKAVVEEVITELQFYAKRESFNFGPRFVINAMIAFFIRKGEAGNVPAPYELKRQIHLAARQSHQQHLSRVRQRKEELITSLLIKKRSPQGNFCLHKNFARLCGKNGCNLTTSQKHRIALARVFLCDPRIIILDDLHLGMDKENANLVGKAMEEAMYGRTTILVSTQPEALRKCDSVCIFGDAGTIKEQGTFEELSKNPDSLYHKITQ